LANRQHSVLSTTEKPFATIFVANIAILHLKSPIPLQSNTKHETKMEKTNQRAAEFHHTIPFRDVFQTAGGCFAKKLPGRELKYALLCGSMRFHLPMGGSRTIV
jgi:hypothetical protein